MGNSFEIKTMKAVGIDGCKAGWIAACYEDEKVLLFSTLEKLVNHYADGYIFLIDIPLGLASEKFKPRTCEEQARRVLPANKKSSVFPVPCREALYALTYAEANDLNKKILGKGISKQSWFIMPKIKEANDFLICNPDIKSRLKESHPEIAFQFLNDGKPLIHRKKTPEGVAERLRIVSKLDDRSEMLYVKALLGYRRYEVAKDDILDALCLALMQQVITANPDKYVLSSFPSNPSLDDKGIEMAIYYGVER